MRVGGALMFASVLAVSGCGTAALETQVRSADDVQVMTPEAVALARSEIGPLETTPPSLAPGETLPPGATTETVPLNRDDRPPELKLFDAYAKFKSCIEDTGNVIQGDLQDQNNPAYKDPEYVKVITTCAARTDIIEILREMQATRADLNPEEVETRNKAFKLLEACLKEKDWKIETTTDKIGLINPSVFQSPDGSIDQGDINECLEAAGINDATNGNGG